MLGKAIPWSYSKLSLWLKCQRKWQYKYLHKIPEDYGPAAQRGNLVHKAFEEFVQGSRDMLSILNDKSKMLDKVSIANLQKMNEILEFFKDEFARGTLATEMKVTFNDKFEPVEPYSAGHYGTAIFDVTLDIDGELSVFDYKTGKVYSDDHQMQAMIYAYVIYKMTGEIPHVVFIYVDQGGETSYKFNIDDMTAIGGLIEDVINEIEGTNETLYEQNVTNLCNYCGYKKMCRGYGL